MLPALCKVVSKGGAVLWAHQAADTLQTDPTDAVIKDVLLQNKSQDSINQDAYSVRWSLANDHNLIFIVVYLNLSRVNYIDQLLDEVKSAFCTTYAGQLKAGQVRKPQKFSKFTASYVKIVSSVVRGSGAAPNAPAAASGRSNPGSAASSSSLSARRRNPGAKPAANSDSESGESSASDSDSDADAPEAAASFAPIRRARPGGPGGFRRRKKDDKTPKDGDAPSKAPSWDPMRRSLTREEQRGLHVNRDSTPRTPEHSLSMQDLRQRYGIEEHSESESESDDEVPATSSFFSSVMSGFSTQKELTEANIVQVINTLRDKLVAKNVAAEIATQVCDSLRVSLLGRKVSRLASVTAEVREALVESLERILNADHSVNVLGQLARVQEQEGRPLVIAMIGVNGVGKSTSLSKIAHMLLRHGKRVMIAAGDTFRSGAVEQLKTHMNGLRVSRGLQPLARDERNPGPVKVFDMGYGNRKPSEVARMAILEAKATGYDVVLVDTAGRMQNNGPLMRELSLLVRDNRPDLVLFVGEALAGSDSVDQLREFSKLLQEVRTPAIDGIVLTKYDTVDDKVGASVSMTYLTRTPVAFVGTGQRYKDLQQMNVKKLIKQLLQ